MQTTNALTVQAGMNAVTLRSDVILDGRFAADLADALAMAVRAAGDEARIVTQLALAALPQTSATALQRAFLENEIESGTQIVVWPADDPTETVWLEYDPVTTESRLASDRGGGQSTTEEIMLNINIALYLAIVNLANCAAYTG